MTTPVTTTPNGTVIDLDSVPQIFTYNGDGTVNYITATLGGISYRQTFGYTSGAVTSISQWVQQ